MIVIDNETPEGRSVGKVRPILRGKGTLKTAYLATMSNKYKGPKPRSSINWA